MLIHLSSAQWFALFDWLIVAFLLGCSIFQFRSARRMRRMEHDMSRMAAHMSRMAAQMAHDLLEIEHRKREQEKEQ